MLTYEMSSEFDDGVTIIRHDLGDLQIDSHHHVVKGRCIGRAGWHEQMLLLHQLMGVRS